jgi:hypothetical protein
MRVSSLLALATLATFASHVPAADACARMDPEDLPLTPDGTEVAANGGVIMTIGWAFGRHPGELVLRTAGSKAAPTVHAIAPQLTVLQPAPGHDVELVDGDGKVVRKFTIAASAAPALASPAIAQLASTAPKPSSNAVQRVPVVPSTNLAITLAAAPPADAFALVYYAAGKTPEARGWIAVTANQKAYTMATGGKGCHGANAYPTFQGETLRFAWLDRGGRVSAMSSAVRVGVAKP